MASGVRLPLHFPPVWPWADYVTSVLQSPQLWNGDESCPYFPGLPVRQEVHNRRWLVLIRQLIALGISDKGTGLRVTQERLSVHCVLGVVLGRLWGKQQEKTEEIPILCEQLQKTGKKLQMLNDNIRKKRIWSQLKVYRRCMRKSTVKGDNQISGLSWPRKWRSLNGK